MALCFLLMQSMTTLATFAEYYRIGLESGLLVPEEAQIWADSLIAELVDPPFELIEVSWSKGLASTMDSLKEVRGDRDRPCAGSLLLGYLRKQVPPDDDGLVWTVRRAMHIARAAGLSDDIYYQFDLIEDEIWLARNGTYGSVDDCRKDFLHALKGY